MNKIIKPAIILLTISAIAAVLIGVVYNITKSPIEKQNKSTEQTAMNGVMPLADNFTLLDLSSIDNVSPEIISLESGTKNNELVGYVIGVVEKGYGGDVKMFVGIDTNGIITGVDLTSHNETPGLGANAETPEFKEQYIGKNGKLTVSKTTAKDNEIQAMTGATITSNCVTKGVNAATDFYDKVLVKNDNIKELDENSISLNDTEDTKTENQPLPTVDPDKTITNENNVVISTDIENANLARLVEVGTVHEDGTRTYLTLEEKLAKIGQYPDVDFTAILPAFSFLVSDIPESSEFSVIIECDDNNALPIGYIVGVRSNDEHNTENLIGIDAGTGAITGVYVISADQGKNENIKNILNNIIGKTSIDGVSGTNLDEESVINAVNTTFELYKSTLKDDYEFLLKEDETIEPIN